MTGHAVLISVDEPFKQLVDEGGLRALAQSVLQAEDVEPCELSVSITDDETVRELNRRYAGEDAVTDVLSFSQREGEEFVAAPEGLPPLGDVVIAYPYAARQADGRPRGGIWDASQGQAVRQAQGERKWDEITTEEPHPPPGDLKVAATSAGSKGERRWSVHDEIEWLLVHGVLHLLGYDHAEAEEEQRMRARERELMGAING